MNNAVTAALCIMLVVLIASLVMVYREPYAPSCNSTLPGCEERFFGNRTTAEDVGRAGEIINRSMGEIVEGIIK